MLYLSLLTDLNTGLKFFDFNKLTNFEMNKYSETSWDDLFVEFCKTFH